MGARTNRHIHGLGLTTGNVVWKGVQLDTMVAQSLGSGYGMNACISVHEINKTMAKMEVFVKVNRSDSLQKVPSLIFT